MKALFLTLIALSMVACSVTSTPVENRPPVIGKDVAQLSVVYGTFNARVASGFLWPEGPLADRVKTVSIASHKMDYFQQVIKDLNAEIEQLSAEWADKACIDNYAAVKPADPELDNHVSEWVPETEMNKTELARCKFNQDQRESDSVKKDSATQAISVCLGNINDAIEPDKNAAVKNTKWQDAQNTKIEILRVVGGTKVKVTLANFLVAGNSPTTEMTPEQLANPDLVAARLITNASYEEQFRSLKFDVSEVDSNGKATGRIYKFVLERAADVLGLARFTGAMDLTDGGQLIRHGMARIDAAASEQTTGN